MGIYALLHCKRGFHLTLLVNPIEPQAFMSDEVPLEEQTQTDSSVQTGSSVPPFGYPEPRETLEPVPLVKPTAGTSIPGTTTLATLFSTCFTNISGQHGTPTFQWSGPNEIIANFTAATTQNASSSMMHIRMEARAFWPATIS
jgi:hypothetical protein